MASMAVGAEFSGAGAAPGLEMWRIENKIPVRKTAAEAACGKFHAGDSYIILKTIQNSGALSWNLHFWLGAESSQDEMGIAAYKTVELDESLGGGPVQYRECQGHESDLFMSYYRDVGIEYLAGGVESGFAHVERDSYNTRLLHIKGKRVVRCNEVPCQASSLNTGDCFILDMGLELYVWNGPQANRKEKTKASEMALSIRNNERGARANITIMDEDPHNAAFWGALGGEQAITNAGEDDDAAEARSAANTRLFRVSDASGSLQVTEVPKNADGRLTRDMLDTSDCFLVSSGSEVFVWVGKGVSAAERREGMMRGADFISQNNMPAHTPITRVAEGAENSIFKSLFYQWTPPRNLDFTQTSSSGVAAAREQKAIDFGALHAGQQEEEPMIDDCSGSLQIWKVVNFQKEALPQNEYGQFYSGDSYVMLYTYQKSGAEEYVIYFWQGSNSSTDEKGASALLAKDLDDEYQDRPIQIRVVQGKEPRHFRTLFNGRMVIHQGGAASGFKNRGDADSYDADGISLFHIKGTAAENTCAVQVDERACNLNSGDCFVLLTPTHMYNWQGNGSNDAEKQVASTIADLLKDHNGVAGRQVVTVAEGSEDADFWAALGGQAEYPSFAFSDEPPREPRLFQCSNATGAFEVEEIFMFTQEDLCNDDVMMLDTYNTVYVWVGQNAHRDEKSGAMQAAQQYIDAATDGRDKDTPIVRISPGSEPPSFTMHFQGWDTAFLTKNTFLDPYEAKLAAMREAAGLPPVEAPAVPQQSDSTDYSDPNTSKVPYAELKVGNTGSVCIDPARKEAYLSTAEFQTVFGMDINAFNNLPAWKKKAKKKEAALF